MLHFLPPPGTFAIHLYSTHTHARTLRLRLRWFMDCVCCVTWISVASVKAAARAHASTEHAAGMQHSLSTHTTIAYLETHTHTCTTTHNYSSLVLGQMCLMKSSEMFGPIRHGRKLVLLWSPDPLPLLSFTFLTLWGVTRSYTLALYNIMRLT